MGVDAARGSGRLNAPGCAADLGTPDYLTC